MPVETDPSVDDEVWLRSAMTTKRSRFTNPVTQNAPLESLSSSPKLLSTSRVGRLLPG